jgi:hypothetical protein
MEAGNSNGTDGSCKNAEVPLCINLLTLNIQ